MMMVLWNEDDVSFEGSMVSFDPSRVYPNAVQQVRPPTKNFLQSSMPRLFSIWRDSGRNGVPRVAVMGIEPTDDNVRQLDELGGEEMLQSIPDGTESVAVEFLDAHAPLV